MKSKFIIVNIMIILVLIIATLVGGGLHLYNFILKPVNVEKSSLNKLASIEKLKKAQAVNNIYLTFFSKIRYNIVNKGNNTKNMGGNT